MNLSALFFASLTALTVHSLMPKNKDIIKLSATDAVRLGNKIWHNECHGSQEKLTWWKEGEEFASMGIGHFIWYPQSYHGPFVQQFPSLLIFLKRHGITIPTWLWQRRSHCPWTSHHAFFKDFHSVHMQEIRTLLAKTTSLQARFIVEHFQQSLHNVFTRLHPQKTLCEHLHRQLKRLEATPEGIYALIDYANFKGIGIGNNQQEAYNYQGWGLLDVLSNMKGTQPGHVAVQEFAQEAKRALLVRVKNSPPERNEHQWLKGWFNRIDTYNL